MTITVNVTGAGRTFRLGENTTEALRQALISEAAADRAALSEAAAESLVGPTYSSTATGLAATAEGGGFAVDNGDGTVTIYRKVGGAAVVQRTLATAAALAAGDGAERVGFQQAGTGAVPRTVQDKARDIVSVRDFGAVGGISGPFPDDTAAIQAAIESEGLYSAGLGRTLYIPKGLYRLSDTLTPESGCRIHGDGPRQAVLYNEQNPIPDVPAFQASGSFGFATFEGFGARNQKSLLDVAGQTDQNDFRNLHIFGMADAAFRFRDFLQTSVFDRLEIENCNRGIVSESGICNLNVIRDCAFKNIVNESLLLAGSEATIIENPRFEGAGNASKVCIDLTGKHQLIFNGGYAEKCHKTFLRWSGSPEGVVVFNNKHWTFFDDGVPFIWDIAPGAQLVFQNCESTIPMEVPAGSTMIGHNKNIFCANPAAPSASVVTLPQRAELVNITGTTTIDAFTGNTSYLGTKVTLLFSDALTVRDVSTGGNVRLTGGANFSATANDTLTLAYFASGWVEVSRSVN